MARCARRDRIWPGRDRLATAGPGAAAGTRHAAHVAANPRLRAGVRGLADRQRRRNSGGPMNDLRTARLAGALWLVVIAGGVISFSTQSGMPRLAFAADLFSGVCYLGVTILLYQLFKPVDTSIALFAAFCGLAGVASVAAPTQGFYIAMVFFGAQIISIGYLIIRSTLIPQILGVLLLLGGASYVINSFTNFLSPAIGAHLAPFIIPVAILGEGALALWLLVKGVNVSRVPAID